mmetsp:Transcript_95364/g.183941  ORF Transcript_95364/g.183941 Transcript_95364/m.183941 type:complete len:207 (+) Transcript_95364:1458-2078(+)
MLAVPVDLVRCSLVEAQPEGRLVFPHLTCHIVASAKLICKSVSLCVYHQPANSTQSFSSKELNLCIRVIWFHQAGGVDLHPFKVDALCTNNLSHFDSISGAMLTIGCGQVHQVRAISGKQRILGEVRTKSSRSQDDWPMFLELHTTFFVRKAHTCTAITSKQLSRLCFCYDPGLVCFLRHLLQHLNERICDGHAWESLLPAMGSGS